MHAYYFTIVVVKYVFTCSNISCTSDKPITHKLLLKLIFFQCNPTIAQQQYKNVTAADGSRCACLQHSML